MTNIITITWLTFNEARRRRMALAGAILGCAFLLLYGVGVFAITTSLREEQVPLPFLNQAFNYLLLAGLYVVHFLTIMLTIFASVDTIAGEISTHTVQTLVARPLRRWELVLGKWLGLALMLLLYVGFLAGGVVAIVLWLGASLPGQFWAGLALFAVEVLVLLSLSLLGGTVFSTLTNGVVQMMLYGLAFIGSWVEQIGALLDSQAAVRFGIIASLLNPVEALWRRAAYLMQPPLSASIPSPFSVASVPSEAMVIYAGLYALIALGGALFIFHRRDL